MLGSIILISFRMIGLDGLRRRSRWLLLIPAWTTRSRRSSSEYHQTRKTFATARIEMQILTFSPIEYVF